MNADHSLFGWDQPIQPHKPKRGQAKGSAAPIGSGPRGETCGTCKHAYSRNGGRRNYWKCDLVKATGGPGSDIRLKWPACSRFDQKEPKP